jgi:hypothetical protein
MRCPLVALNGAAATLLIAKSRRKVKDGHLGRDVRSGETLRKETLQLGFAFFFGKFFAKFFHLIAAPPALAVDTRL